MSSTLYLTIGSLCLFLSMAIMTQVERASVPGYYSRNPKLQVRMLATVFVLLSLGFGTALLNVSPLLALALAAGFTLALMHPANALCFFVFMLFMRPWEILAEHPLLLALPRLLAATCFVSWLLYPEKLGVPTAQTSRSLKLLLAFSVWIFITAFKAPDSMAAFMDCFNLFFKTVLVFLMCLFVIDDEHSVRQLKRTLIISSFSLIVLSLNQFYFGPPVASAGGRLHLAGMLGDSNDLAAGMVIALPLALAPFYSRVSSAPQKLGAILFAVLSVMAIWYSQSRGALLALLAEFVAIGILYRPRGRSFRMVLMCGVLVAGYFLAPLVLRRDKDEMGISQESRLIYWKAALNMAVHHPILGVGFGRYPINYESYSGDVKYEWGQRTAHSSWVLALAESGFVGGGLFLAFFIALLKRAWARQRTSPDLLYALIGYLVAMSFLSHTYSLYPYLLAGLILSANAVKERHAYEN